MVCKNCGKMLQNGDALCPSCGTPVTENVTEKKKKYTSLVPEFKDVDADKSLSERVADIDAPLFTDEGNVYVKPKKKKARIIILICVLVAFGGLVGVILSQAKKPISSEKAYDEFLGYFERLEAKEQETIKSITFFDVNDSGIQDAVYLTSYNGYMPHGSLWDDTKVMCYRIGMYYDKKTMTAGAGMESVTAEKGKFAVLKDLTDDSIYIYSSDEEYYDEYKYVTKLTESKEGYDKESFGGKYDSDTKKN